MVIAENRVVKKALLFLISANILTFLVYYTVFYLISNNAALYVFYYFTEILNTLLPLITATALFTSYAECGLNKCLLHALFYSLCWVPNLFPYYSFEYAYQGIEISAVLTFATIHTLFMVIVMYIEITVLFLLMIFVSEKIARGKTSAQGESAKVKINPTDFSNPKTLGIFSACAAMFVYNLVCEIIDTVSYIREVEGIYQTGEIVYILVRYIFILLLLIGCHFATVFAKNKLSCDL